MNVLTISERDIIAAARGVSVYEPFEEARPEQRERLRVMRGEHRIGHIVSESFHFTKEEFEQKLNELLAKHQ